MQSAIWQVATLPNSPSADSLAHRHHHHCHQTDHRYLQHIDGLTRMVGDNYDKALPDHFWCFCSHFLCHLELGQICWKHCCGEKERVRCSSGGGGGDGDNGGDGGGGQAEIIKSSSFGWKGGLGGSCL